MVQYRPGFVISKKESYHIGCQHCKGGFCLYEPPPKMLHCPFCGVYLEIGGNSTWQRSADRGKQEKVGRRNNKTQVVEVNYAI